MKIHAFLSIIAVLLSFSISDVFSQTRDRIDGFGNARFGMTLSQLRSAVRDLEPMKLLRPVPGEESFSREALVDGLGKAQIVYTVRARVLDTITINFNPGDKESMVNVRECQLPKAFLDILDREFGDPHRRHTENGPQNTSTFTQSSLWRFSNGSAFIVQIFFGLHALGFNLGELDLPNLNANLCTIRLTFLSSSSAIRYLGEKL